MNKPCAKTRLLDTARKLFGTRVHSEVGIDEIIAESGTAKATFYRLFKSKDQLIETWLKETHDKVRKYQDELLNESGCAVEKIARTFDDLETRMLDNQFRGCPYSNSCVVTDPSCEGIRHLIEHHKRKRRQFFQELAAQVTGEQNEFTEELGDGLFLLFSGAATEAQNLRSVWPIQSAKSAAVKLCKVETGEIS